MPAGSPPTKLRGESYRARRFPLLTKLTRGGIVPADGPRYIVRADSPPYKTEKGSSSPPPIPLLSQGGGKGVVGSGWPDLTRGDMAVRSESRRSVCSATARVLSWWAFLTLNSAEAWHEVCNEHTKKEPARIPGDARWEHGGQSPSAREVSGARRRR